MKTEITRQSSKAQDRINNLFDQINHLLEAEQEDFQDFLHRLSHPIGNAEVGSLNEQKVNVEFTYEQLSLLASGQLSRELQKHLEYYLLISSPSSKRRHKAIGLNPSCPLELTYS